MTNQRPARRPRRPSLLAVAGGSAAAFAIVLALLVAQMRLGRDPMMGARAVAQATSPQRVLLRRVIVKRIVVQLVDSGDAGSGRAARTVVVVPSAALPSATPVAPAPAPPVTRTS